jgi:hypothetical protein
VNENLDYDKRNPAKRVPRMLPIPPIMITHKPLSDIGPPIKKETSPRNIPFSTPEKRKK